MRILVHESWCELCNETNRYFLEFKRNGKICWSHEGGCIDVKGDGKEASVQEALEALQCAKHVVVTVSELEQIKELITELEERLNSNRRNP